MVDEIAALLAEAVASGELVAGVEVDRLARAVRVAYNGSLTAWARTADSPLADSIVTDLDILPQPHYRKEKDS